MNDLTSVELFEKILKLRHTNVPRPVVVDVLEQVPHAAVVLAGRGKRGGRRSGAVQSGASKGRSEARDGVKQGMG